MTVFRVNIYSSSKKTPRTMLLYLLLRMIKCFHPFSSFSSSSTSNLPEIYITNHEISYNLLRLISAFYNKTSETKEKIDSLSWKNKVKLERNGAGTYPLQLSILLQQASVELRIARSSSYLT